MYADEYKTAVFHVQAAEKRRWDEPVFGIIDGKQEEVFFCIIFQAKICVKIIPKLEKNTTQVKNMCYNIVGKKPKGCTML